MCHEAVDGVFVFASLRVAQCGSGLVRLPAWSIEPGPVILFSIIRLLFVH